MINVITVAHQFQIAFYEPAMKNIEEDNENGNLEIEFVLFQLIRHDNGLKYTYYVR